MFENTKKNKKKKTMVFFNFAKSKLKGKVKNRTIKRELELKWSMIRNLYVDIVCKLKHKADDFDHENKTWRRERGR